MKFLFKILLTFFVFVTVISCKAQMVQTVDDAKKLEINQDKFVGKPLSNLLRQIKPEIKRALILPEVGANSYIVFNFLDNSEYNKYKANGKTPLTIRLYIKGPFKSYALDKPIENRYDWTKDDEQKYKDLIVTGIRVYGEN